MNREDLLNLHTEVCGEARHLMKAKNTDYAQDTSVFGNLDMVEHRTNGKRTTEEGILIRLDDKMARLWNFILNGGFAVKDEGFRDTVRDIINYAVLLQAKHSERQKTTIPEVLPSPEEF